MTPWRHNSIPARGWERSRICPKCGNGTLHLKSSRTGGFVGCGNYPECTFTRQFLVKSTKVLIAYLAKMQGMKFSKIWPRSLCSAGRGHERAPKPTRQPAQGMGTGGNGFGTCIDVLNLPREVGPTRRRRNDRGGDWPLWPVCETRPHLCHLKEVDDVFTIGMNRAVEELAKGQPWVRPYCRHR